MYLSKSPNTLLLMTSFSLSQVGSIPFAKYILFLTKHFSYSKRPISKMMMIKDKKRIQKFGCKILKIEGVIQEYCTYKIEQSPFYVIDGLSLRGCGATIIAIFEVVWQKMKAPPCSSSPCRCRPGC